MFKYPCTLCGALVALVAMAYSLDADMKPPKAPVPEAPIVQKTEQTEEIIFGAGCHIAVILEKDFALHVPVSAEGKPDTEHMYVTGAASYSITPDSCGQVHFVRKAVK